MTVRFTYKDVRALKPCQGGLKKTNKLLPNWKERGYTLLEMYNLGVDHEDVLWLAAETPKISSRVKVLFSIGCAERVLPIFEKVYPNDDTIGKALTTARNYLNGLATDDELKSANSAAYHTARATTEAASTGSATWVTHAAASASKATSLAASAAWATSTNALSTRVYGGNIAATWATNAATWATSASTRAAADDVNIARHDEQKWQMEHLEKLIKGEADEKL